MYIVCRDILSDLHLKNPHSSDMLAIWELNEDHLEGVEKNLLNSNFEKKCEFIKNLNKNKDNKSKFESAYVYSQNALIKLFNVNEFEELKELKEFKKFINEFGNIEVILINLVSNDNTTHSVSPAQINENNTPNDNTKNNVNSDLNEKN